MIRSIRILARTGTAVLLAAFFLTAQADDTTSGLLKRSTSGATGTPGTSGTLPVLMPRLAR